MEVSGPIICDWIINHSSRVSLYIIDMCTMNNQARSKSAVYYFTLIEKTIVHLGVVRILDSLSYKGLNYVINTLIIIHLAALLTSLKGQHCQDGFLSMEEIYCVNQS